MYYFDEEERAETWSTPYIKDCITPDETTSLFKDSLSGDMFFEAESRILQYAMDISQVLKILYFKGVYVPEKDRGAGVGKRLVDEVVVPKEDYLIFALAGLDENSPNPTWTEEERQSYVRNQENLCKQWGWVPISTYVGNEERVPAVYPNKMGKLFLEKLKTTTGN